MTTPAVTQTIILCSASTPFKSSLKHSYTLALSRTTPRLYTMGVLSTKKSLVQCDQLPTAAFCRRRLAVVMVRIKMAETLREACTFIEQVRRREWRGAGGGSSSNSRSRGSRG